MDWCWLLLTRFWIHPGLAEQCDMFGSIHTLVIICPDMNSCYSFLDISNNNHDYPNQSLVTPPDYHYPYVVTIHTATHGWKQAGQ